MPLRHLLLGGKSSQTDNLVAKQDLTFNMERANGMKNLFYDMEFTVDHDNAAAITTDVYDFAKNLLRNIKFVTGASEYLFDLSSTDMAIMNLYEHSRIDYTIDKTIGAGKTSTFVLRWDFVLPEGYENPLDTVFHSDSMKYNMVQLKMKPQKTFDSIADCTITGVAVKIIQKFKKNPKPAMVEKVVNGNRQVVPVPALNKVIKTKEFGFNSDVTNQVIELPVNTTILGFYALVMDENEVVKADGISNISIKNGKELFYDSTFADINKENRKKLYTFTNALFDNIAFVDIAEGQMSEALNTGASEHTNTVLSFDLTASAGTNVLKIMYLTVEDA